MRMAHDAAEPVSRSLPTIAGSGWWKRRQPLMLSVLALIFFANSAVADNDGPVRFHEVTAWRGSLVATARANPATMSRHDEFLRKAGGKGTNWNFQFNAYLSVDFVLDEYESDPSVWTGKVTGSEYSAGYHYFAYLPEHYANDPDWKGYGEIEWDYSANGALDFKGDSRVELQFHRERGWSVRMPSGRLPTEARSYYFRHAPTKEEQNPEKDLIIDHDTTMREKHNVTATGMGGTGNHPYPKTVSVLLGQSDTHEGSFPLIYGTMGVAPDVIWDYTVYLEPTSMDELRLVIDEPAEYATWRPETTPGVGAGPALEVTARVETAKGGVPKTKVEQFVWELVQTSKEPGVALNWPLDAKDTRFDLDLDATGGYFQLSNEKQKLERAVQQGFSDTAKVIPYDWGGWSTLQVTAILTDGRRIRGKLKGKSETGLRVPKRASDSHIADGWKKTTGASGADKDDDEKIDGQKDNGDGYTLYEEYRGWVEDGKHIEGDPKGKDFFVLNLIGGDAEPGIDLFADVSQLKVHAKLRPDEMSEEKRLMNGNHREGAHRENDQHGVWVKTFGSKSDLGDDGAMTTMMEKGVAGRPGITKGVGILARDDTGSTFSKPFNLPVEDAVFAFDRGIAHELLHSVGVEHHGSGDYKTDMFFIFRDHPKNRLGKSYYTLDFKTKKPIRVLDEAGQDLAADSNTEIIIQAFRNSYISKYLADARKQYAIDLSTGDRKSEYASPEAMAEEGIYDTLALTFGRNGALVGVEHGEDSGDQDCLMRYYFANFYEGKGPGEKTLYSVAAGTERIGLELCRSGQGTGINDAGHKPQSRYGDAAGDAGNCFEQICPNDSIPPRAVK